jgi:hypothetical protein
MKTNENHMNGASGRSVSGLIPLESLAEKPRKKTDF